MKTPSLPPDVTVIICTRNRARQLEKVLNSAVQLKTPAGLSWELIVVDNGSTDLTSEVVKSYEDRLPIRLVREDQPGLSNARNKGVADAAGRYICWTDDDVVLDPGWLGGYCAAFERHPEAAIFGGRIEPVLEAPATPWFAKLSDRWPITILMAKRDFGDAPCRLGFAEEVIPFGANFAIRTVEQRLVSYEPGLGVSPSHRRIGEEAEVMFRLMAAGAVGWWVPEAKVWHMIPVQRQTWDYIYDFSAAYGETLAYLEQTWPDGHHLSSATDLDRLKTAPSLQFREAAYWLASKVARMINLKARAARLLATAGFYGGAARLQRLAANSSSEVR